MITCLVDSLFPDVARSILSILQSCSVKVHIPDGQTCCGQPAFNGGYWQEARKIARHTLDVFDKDDNPVIIPSGSCGAMIAHYYPELFKDDPVYAPKAERLSARVVEFTQYLVDVLGKPDLGATFDAKVVYHPSCHLLRGLKIDAQPRELLANVRGLNLLEQDDADTCCGFGGVFAVKMGSISKIMLEKRLDAFYKTGANYIVGCDVSCLMHIEGGLRKQGSPVRTLHIAQLLAEGMR